MTNQTRLVLVGCLTLGVCGSASFASARSSSGYDAFRPWPNYNSQLCVNEDWGGAINLCASTINTLIFQLPVDSSGVKDRGAIADDAPPSKSQISYEDQREYLQTLYSNQQRDTVWSRTASSRVTALFNQLARPGTGTTLQSVDCRDSLCRVELTHETEGGFHDFMDDWTYSDARLAWKGPMSGGKVAGTADGRVTTVIFVAKEGTELPWLE